MSAEATGRGTLTMTPKEVAERLGISEWWVREQIRRGRVPHLRFGRHGSRFFRSTWTRSSSW